MIGSVGRPVPRLMTLWRLRVLLAALAAGGAGGLLALSIARNALQLAVTAALTPAIVAAGVVALAVALLGDWHARRAYAVCRWQHLPDEGVVAWSGAWWQREIWIPLTRLQHLDVVRGPLERRLGLASLELYTAGTHDHRVRLPGMEPLAANQLRDALLGELQRRAGIDASAPLHDDATGPRGDNATGPRGDDAA